VIFRAVVDVGAFARLATRLLTSGSGACYQLVN
jgi:hypothetical protein